MSALRMEGVLVKLMLLPISLTRQMVGAGAFPLASDERGVSARGIKVSQQCQHWGEA